MVKRNDTFQQLNKETEIKNQNSLRELEQFYTTNTVDTMFETIEEQKNKITSEIIKYADNSLVEDKFDRNGNVLTWKHKINPLVITNYFFKPITPIVGQEPIYNAEKLGMVFDYYCYILAEVNDKIGDFPSSLTSFCKLAGITLTTLRRYKNSQDYNMRVVVEKIYDQIGDENITMSQMGYVKERSTIFKMKSQNEIVEKEQPKISVKLSEKVDVNKINKKLDEYRQFATKKGRR